ncbi:hypothetical protein K443DRAFT_67331, partial [Laccaria amethystina LaAM-08-1]
FKKLREGATTFVSWEISPKTEGACPKREIDIDRLQSLLIDYKICRVCFLRLQKFVVSAISL